MHLIWKNFKKMGKTVKLKYLQYVQKFKFGQARFKLMVPMEFVISFSSCL